MLTYPWKCTVLHCNHLGNTWKPLVLMTRHFDYCPSASKGDNQSVRSSAPVVSFCFPGGYNVKLYISRGRLAWWLLSFFCTVPLAHKGPVTGALPQDLYKERNMLSEDGTLISIREIPYIFYCSWFSKLADRNVKFDMACSCSACHLRHRRFQAWHSNV